MRGPRGIWMQLGAPGGHSRVGEHRDANVAGQTLRPLPSYGPQARNPRLRGAQWKSPQDWPARGRTGPATPLSRGEESTRQRIDLAPGTLDPDPDPDPEPPGPAPELPHPAAPVASYAHARPC